MAYISSVIPPKPLPSDFLIDPAKVEFQSTCLKRKSVLRLHKLATLNCSVLKRYLGVLDGQHRPVIAAKLKELLAL